MHPLYLGPVLKNMKYPGDVDVRLNIGNQYGEVGGPNTTLISIRRDPTSLGRVGPVDMGLVADNKLAAADLVAAVKSLATADRLRQIAGDRLARTKAYTDGMKKLRDAMLTGFPSADGGPVTLERLAYELELGLEKDTIYVNDTDSGKKDGCLHDLRCRRQDVHRQRAQHSRLGFIGRGRRKTRAARFAGRRDPRRRRVSLRRPATTVESSPLQHSGLEHRAQQPQLQQRTQSYLDVRLGPAIQVGSRHDVLQRFPDVDFVKASEAFGVEGELVKEPGQIKAAIARGKRATAEGRPYLLEVLIQRDGVGAGSTWYPPFSVAAMRTRHV